MVDTTDSSGPDLAESNSIAGLNGDWLSSVNEAPALNKTPIVVSAALARGLAGDYEESVADGNAPDDGFSPLERAMLLATLGSGAEAIQKAQRDPNVFACPDDAAGATILTVLEETAPQFGTVVDNPVDGKEVKFDGVDLAGWASAAWPWVKNWLNIGRVSFPPGPFTPTVIPDGVKVAVLGDWGTGLYGAPYCASSIEADPNPPQVLIHLGDVYYTGTEHQIKTRFLEPWPKVPGAVSRACNSNHEMLSGGAPYKGLTLPAFQQSSSLWWLQNNSWDLVGLDTGWEEGTIGDLQLIWFERILRDARRAGRNTLAFSHHMPWQTMEHELKHKLIARVEHLLDDGLLDGWYFGHEHLCALFERHPSWGLFGTCIGHSGYPYWPLDHDDRNLHKTNSDGSSWWRHEATADVPASYLLDGENPYVKGHEDKYGPNGYATLELGDGAWTENILNPAGAVLARRNLRPSDAEDGGGGQLL